VADSDELWVAAHCEEEALMKAEKQLHRPAGQLTVQQGTNLHSS